MSVEDVSKYIDDHKKMVTYSEDGDPRSEYKLEALAVADVYELVLKLINDTTIVLRKEKVKESNVSLRTCRQRV